MTSIKTKKYINQVLNHPYVGMRILPFLGDFAGHAGNVNKSLYNEGEINKKEFEFLNSLILSVEQNENEKDLNALLKTFRQFL